MVPLHFVVVDETVAVEYLKVNVVVGMIFPVNPVKPNTVKHDDIEGLPCESAAMAAVTRAKMSGTIILKGD